MQSLEQATQQNAASAEEFSATGHELLSQAQQVDDVLNQLRAVVNGAGNGQKRVWSPAKKPQSNSSVIINQGSYRNDGMSMTH